MSDSKHEGVPAMTPFAEMEPAGVHALFDLLSNPAMYGEMGDRIMESPVETVGFIAEITADDFLRAVIPAVSEMAAAGERVSLARVREVVCEEFEVDAGFCDWAAHVAMRRQAGEVV